MGGRMQKNKNNLSLTLILLFLREEGKKKEYLEINMDWLGKMSMDFVK